MIERRITMHRKQDKTPVVLNPEDKKKLLEMAKGLSGIAGYLHELVTDEKLTVETANTVCGLTESYSVRIHEVLDYKGQLVEETTQRYKEIRSLNEENRELRKQLGERVHNDDVRERFKNMKNFIRDWWIKFGCGYVQDVSLHEGYMKVRVSFMISGIGKEKSEVLEILRKQGAIVEQSKADSDDFEVVDCDTNKNWFNNLVTSTFPSGTVWEMKSWGGKNFALREAEFNIRNLDDIDNAKTKTQ